MNSGGYSEPLTNFGTCWDPLVTPHSPLLTRIFSNVFLKNKILALAYCPFQRARKIAFAGTEAIKRCPNLEEGGGGALPFLAGY